MDPQDKGHHNEQRALNAFKELAQRSPELVRSARRASPGMDARGIDIIVDVILPDSIKRRHKRKKSMAVPVQIKSSKRHVKKWKVVHSDLHDAGVLVFYVRDDITPRELRRLLYRGLHKVQLNSRGGTLYQGLFQRLFSAPRNAILRRNAADIKQRRALEKKGDTP